MDLLRDISMLMNMVVMMAVSAATFFSVLMLMMMNMVVMMAVSAATLLRVYAHDDEHDHIFLPVHDDDRGDGRILLCFHYDYVFHDTSVILDLVCS